MRTRPKRPTTDPALPRREDFATWTDYSDALAESEVDDFALLLELPETLDDWVDHEEAAARRWFAAQPCASGPPLETYLDRARERAHQTFITLKGTP